MHAATLTAVVVFPTPPFWLAIAYTVPIRRRTLPRGSVVSSFVGERTLDFRVRVGVCGPFPGDAGIEAESRPPSRRGRGFGHPPRGKGRPPRPHAPPGRPPSPRPVRPAPPRPPAAPSTRP